MGEQRGIVSRSREAVLEILNTRFGGIPTAISTSVNRLEDPEYLKEVLGEAVTTPSIEAFEAALKR